MKYICLSLSLVFAACNNSVPDASIDCNVTPEACKASIEATPTPTPTATPDPRFETIYNLEYYAKVSSPTDGTDLMFRAINAVDDKLTTPTTNSTGAFHIWAPGKCTDSNAPLSGVIDFVWSTPVEINSLKIYNASVKDMIGNASDRDVVQKVKQGKILFYEDDTSPAILSEMALGELPADDKPKDFPVNLSGKFVKKMSIKITSAEGQCAGLSEVTIIGTRQAGDYKGKDVAPFSRAYEPSDVLGPITTGPVEDYKVLNMKDGNASTSWRTTANGINTQVSIKFDQPYCLKTLKFTDGSKDSGTINEASIQLDDHPAVKFTFSSGVGTYAVPSDITDVKKMIFRVVSLNAGKSNSTGLSNTEFITCP